MGDIPPYHYVPPTEPNLRDLKTEIRAMPIAGRTDDAAQHVRMFSVMDMGQGSTVLKVYPYGPRTLTTLSWAALTGSATVADVGLAGGAAIEFGDPALATPRPNRVMLYINWTKVSATYLHFKLLSSPTLDTTLSNWYTAPNIDSPIAGVAQVYTGDFKIAAADAGRICPIFLAGDAYFTVVAYEDGTPGGSLQIKVMTLG